MRSKKLVRCLVVCVAFFFLSIAGAQDYQVYTLHLAGTTPIALRLERVDGAWEATTATRHQSGFDEKGVYRHQLPSLLTRIQPVVVTGGDANSAEVAILLGTTPPLRGQVRGLFSNLRPRRRFQVGLAQLRLQWKEEADGLSGTWQRLEYRGHPEIDPGPGDTLTGRVTAAPALSALAAGTHPRLLCRPDQVEALRQVARAHPDLLAALDEDDAPASRRAVGHAMRYILGGKKTEAEKALAAITQSRAKGDHLCLAGVHESAHRIIEMLIALDLIYDTALRGRCVPA